PHVTAGYGLDALAARGLVKPDEPEEVGQTRDGDCRLLKARHARDETRQAHDAVRDGERGMDAPMAERDGTGGFWHGGDCRRPPACSGMWPGTLHFVCQLPCCPPAALLYGLPFSFVCRSLRAQSIRSPAPWVRCGSHGQLARCARASGTMDHQNG